MSEKKYRSDLASLKIEKKESKNEVFVPLTPCGGEKKEAEDYSPKRIIKEEDTKLKSGDRILHVKKVKSGRSMYNDPSFWEKN